MNMNNMNKDYAFWTWASHLIIGVTATILAMAIAYFTSSGALGAAAFVILPLLYLRQGFFDIPNNPPTVGVVTLWGKRTDQFLSEGLHWLPFNGLLFSTINVDVSKRNVDLVDVDIRTPDRVENKASISYVFRPDKENLLAFLDSRGEEGVKNILNDRIQERAREWALKPDEGPRTWQEAAAAQADAASVLLKAVAGESLNSIPSSVPTLLLMTYFGLTFRMEFQDADLARYGRERRMESRKKEIIDPKTGAKKTIEVDVLEDEQMWRKEATELVRQKIEAEIQKDYASTYSSAYFSLEGYISALKNCVKERAERIREIREGRGTVKLPSLGIILVQLTVKNIVPVSAKIREAAEKTSKERSEREAERLEMEHKNQLIVDHMAMTGCSYEEAANFIGVNLDDQRVRKEIRTFQLDITPGSREAVKSIGPGLGLAATALFAGGRQQGNRGGGNNPRPNKKEGRSRQEKQDEKGEEGQ